MRFIGSRVHGILDYLVGALLIAAPWLFDFNRGGAETWVPVVLGVSALLYSLMTNYELGVMKALSLRTHLWLDGMSGVLLAASPWFFGFADHVWMPHVVVGVVEILTSLITKREPDSVRDTPGRPQGYTGRTAMG